MGEDNSVLLSMIDKILKSSEQMRELELHNLNAWKGQSVLESILAMPDTANLEVLNLSYNQHWFHPDFYAAECFPLLL